MLSLKHIAVAISLFTPPVFAQTVQQSGTVTRNHIPVWIASGVIGDGGSSAGSPITSIGVTNNGGQGLCINSAATTPGSSWNALCFGASTTGPATISLQNFGGATPQVLQFLINGSNQTFPTLPFSNSNLAPMAASTIKCNPTGSIANVQDCTIGSSLSFSGSTLNATLAANSITNSQLAQMTADTVKCNPTGSTANAQDCANPVIAGITINPTAASANTGFVVNQTGPTTGTQGTNLSLNQVNITSDQSSVTHATYGVDVEFTTGGSNTRGSKVAGNFNVTLGTAGDPAGPARDHIGVVGRADANSGDGGTNVVSSPRGTIFGFNPGSFAHNGATALAAVAGGEIDVGLDTGSSTHDRWGVSVVDASGASNIQGSVHDAAVEIGGTGPGWLNAIFLSNLHGAHPLSSGGCVLCTDGSAVTITTGIDLSAYTITGNIFNSQPFRVSGTGVFSRYSAAGGNVPSVGSCTGLGTGTCSMVAGSLDNVGEILLSPTGSPAATGNLTITFGTAWATHGGICTFTAHNSSAGWTDPVSFHATAGLSTTTYSVQWANGSSIALTAGQTYLIDYICMGF